MTSATAHGVCAAVPPPPSSLHSCALQLFIVLFGRKPGIIPVSSHQHQSFLYVVSFICSPLNLAVLLKIWVFFFRSGSRTFCGAPGRDVTTSCHLRAPLRFAVLAPSQQVSPRTSLCWVPAWGRRRGQVQKECLLRHSQWEQLLVTSVWSNSWPRSSLKGVLIDTLQALSLPLGTSWLPVP